MKTLRTTKEAAVLAGTSCRFAAHDNALCAHRNPGGERSGNCLELESKSVQQTLHIRYKHYVNSSADAC